jgi:hypothetical protein
MALERIGRIIDATCAVIDGNAELLTRLDSAIGDGDHGHNMRRGFRRSPRSASSWSGCRSDRRCRRPAWRW